MGRWSEGRTAGEARLTLKAFYKPYGSPLPLPKIHTEIKGIFDGFTISWGRAWPN